MQYFLKVNLLGGFLVATAYRFLTGYDFLNSMESHSKESDQEDVGEISSQLDSAMHKTHADTTDDPANAQSEERAVQDTTNLEESEQRMEREVRFSSVTSVTEEVQEESEAKDIADVKVKENSRKMLKEVQEVEKEFSYQDPPKVDSHSALENIGIDLVSELRGVSREECLPSTSTKSQFENVSGIDVSLEISELSNDKASDTATSSTNASTSSLQSSQAIAIPSISRDSPGLESNFYPRNATSVHQKFPIPIRKGHNVYLRDSPESSDYYGSPDSLEDPFLMEALYSSENKKTEDHDTYESSGSILCPMTPIDSEEIEKPSKTGLIERGFDHPSESIEESFDDHPSASTEESLDDHPSASTEDSIDDHPSASTEESLDDHPSASTEESLDDHPSASTEESLGDHASVN